MNYEQRIEEILNMDFDKKSNWYISGFTVEREEKERLVKELTALLKEVREEAVKEYENEQAKSILEKGSPNYLGFDTPDRKLSKKYEELLHE